MGDATADRDLFRGRVRLVMTDAERGDEALERALAAIRGVDQQLEESAAEREARAQRVRNDRLARMTAPAAEAIQRPQDRLGDPEQRAAMAQHAAAAQSSDTWNTWFRKSFESQLPDIWRVMGEALGQAIGEERAEIEQEAAAKIEVIKGELVRAFGESLARQRHEIEREFALLRAEISKLKGSGSDRS